MSGRQRILVVGDSMLDRYWSGDADRLSPEAPVPVLLMRDRTSRAGGAANVATNLAALDCDVTLVTLIGDDDAGRELLGLLPGVRVEVVRCAATTEKIRTVSRRHQLLRIDIEAEPPERCAAEVAAEAVRALPGHDIVVLSDYAKGALARCPEIIAAATAAGARVLVDPKGRDFSRYRGAWLLKPNEQEFAEVTGQAWSDEDFDRRAEGLRGSLDLEHLLVTRGERGMRLYTRHTREPFVVQAERREVFDVCGAGDTVLATIAAKLSHGAEMREAVVSANRAAGIVVGRFGTSAVTMEELQV